MPEAPETAAAGSRAAGPDFLVVPLWQGSSSARAMSLQAGAEAICADLPASRTRIVEIPVEAGDDLGTPIRRLSAVQHVQAQVREALSASTPPVLLVGGDASADLAGVAHALERDPDTCLLWLGAHAALHDGVSSPDGAAHRMVVRALMGSVHPSLTPPRPLERSRLVLAGVRGLDEAEADFARQADLAIVPPDAPDWPSAVAEAVAATGAGRLYIHVDVDVLDPAEILSVHFPEPFGVTVPQLLAAIAAARAVLPLAGAAIAEFSPDSPDDVVADMGTVLRLVGALRR